MYVTCVFLLLLFFVACFLVVVLMSLVTTTLLSKYGNSRKRKIRDRKMQSHECNKKERRNTRMNNKK